MFEVYAAQMEYRLTADAREHDLRVRAQRSARSEPERPARRRRARRVAVAWPRPIALHA